MNQPSGHEAWKGPPRTPPPKGARMTSGRRMPERQCVFAATVTIMSKGQVAKSANWSSTTGRSPIQAAPIAAPTKPSSAIGVSTTRSSPNSSQSPLVTPNAPPKCPTSSPRMKTRLSSRSASASAARIASRYVISLTASSREIRTRPAPSRHDTRTPRADSGGTLEAGGGSEAPHPGGGFGGCGRRPPRGGSRGDPPVDEERGARHVRRLVGGEEERGCDDLLHRREAAEGGLRQHLGAQAF